MGAMAVASPDIVSMLLEHGASPLNLDINENDALAFASVFGNIETSKYWLQKFPHWNLNRRHGVAGGTVLTDALYMGQEMRYIELLLDHGANVNVITKTGSSVLTTLCSSEDCDPRILSRLLKIKSTHPASFV